MRRKFVIALALMTLLSSASVIYGCGSNTTNNTTNNTDGVKEDVAKVGEGLKESAEGVVEGVKDVGKDIKYTAINFTIDR